MTKSTIRHIRRRAWPALAAGLALGLSGPALAAGDNTLEHAAESVENAAGELASDVGDVASDLRLHTLLEAKLAANDELSALTINTDVRDGIASLDGDVSSEAQKTLAGEVALSVDGIHSVRNNLHINTDGPSLADEVMDEVDDAALTAAVKSRLLLSEHTSGLGIDVDTTNHVVTLSGDVDSGAEKQLAGLVAANTSGVEYVVNTLVVRAD